MYSGKIAVPPGGGRIVEIILVENKKNIFLILLHFFKTNITLQYFVTFPALGLDDLSANSCTCRKSDDNNGHNEMQFTENIPMICTPHIFYFN
jgi:hypothetical protein